VGEKLLIVEDEFIVANDLRLVLEQAGYQVCGIAASVEEARSIIKKHQVDIVLLDIHLKGKLTGIDLAKELKEENIAFVYLSANSNQQILEAAKATEPYGFLVKPFRERDVLVTLDIARYRHKHSVESKLRQESVLGIMFADISTHKTAWQQKLLETATALQSYIPFDYFTVCLRTPEEPFINGCSFLRIGFNEYQVLGAKELSVVSGLAEAKLYNLFLAAPVGKMAAVFNGKEFDANCNGNALKKMYADTFQLAAELSFPLFISNDQVVTFSFFSRNVKAYHSEHLALLIRLQQPLSAIADSMPVVEKKQLYDEPVTDNRQGKKNTPVPSFDGIVGNSSSLLYVLDLITLVAPLDASVLILGESGTGKERIADSIHQRSPRKDKPLVKINCATLPDTLIESELFGHEKGAFTGAVERKIGKFELASGGTIFLDEVGELPPDQQVKLLRVLQEKEIERIGGKAPIKIDVRVIAATNRNLEKEVAERHFRLDLYYRLNVFPILLPALRERKEDIPQLANYFAKRFCSKFNKSFSGIKGQMMSELEAYHWPGNIRELENIIEQSVILNDGKSEISLKRVLPHTLNTESNGVTPVTTVTSLGDIKNNMQRSEKEYICSILKKTNGRIRGKGGAAELLNQKPTTLESRIAKLGIKKEDFY